MGAWAVPVCLDMQEGWRRQAHTRLRRASNVPQTRGKGSALSHFQVLPV